MIKKIFFVFILFLTVVKITQATEMESDRYRIQMGNLNSESGTMTSTSNVSLSTTLGELAAGQFTKTGFVVKAGFQYLNSIIPFTFTISNTNIRFNELQPNQTATGGANLTVSFGGAYKYTVSTIAETRLQTLDGAKYIPDTLCDTGYTCYKNSANVWTLAETEGFGYNMIGEDIASDFIDNTYFRPFPIRTLGDLPETIMESDNVTLELVRPYTHQSTIVFKTNITPVQAAGNYQAIINFVATPGY